MEDIKEQCRAAFYFGEKGGHDLTLDDGGANEGEEARQVNHAEMSDTDDGDDTTATYSFGTSDNQLDWKAPRSPDTMAPVTAERSSSDEQNVTSENTPPSPPSGNAHILSVASEEIFDPRVHADFSSARSRAVAVANHTGEPSLDKSERHSAPSGKPQLNPSGSRLTLSFRQRTQEELVPQRRTKPSRPGRGRAPLGDETSLSPPPVVLQHCRFEKQGPSSSAEVV